MCIISLTSLTALCTLLVRQKSPQIPVSLVPFLYASSVPGISKTVPHDPRPIVLKHSAFRVDWRAACLIFVANVGTTLVERATFRRWLAVFSAISGGEDPAISDKVGYSIVRMAVSDMLVGLLSSKNLR